MARPKKLSEEEVEELRDTYNKLKIKEEELLKEYIMAQPLPRIAIAGILRDTALNILSIANKIDRNTKAAYKKQSSH